MRNLVGFILLSMFMLVGFQLEIDAANITIQEGSSGYAGCTDSYLGFENGSHYGTLSALNNGDSGLIRIDNWKWNEN